MRKKIYSDMILNIGSASITVAVLQIFIYPFLSRKLDADTYGFIISIVSFVILISDSLGKSINNTRLIHNDEKNAAKGDYNIVLLIFLLLCFLITSFGVAFYNLQLTMTFPQKCIWIIIAGLTLINTYLIVYFRIQINYINIFKNALIDSLGLIIGYFIYTISGEYVYIFLFEQVFQFIYLFKMTKLLREPIKKTSNFRLILMDSSLLAISAFLSQFSVQADKLLLLPMLGGESLANYHTATLLGKVVYLVMSPISGVILSYIVGLNKLTQRQFRKYIVLCLIACFALSVVMVIISRPILGFLFPLYVDGAMRLILFTTANVLLYTMIMLINPIVMKYCDMHWQIIVNAVGVVSYILFSILFLKLYGIVGFCIGISVSYSIKLTIMLIIYSKKRKKL